MNAVQAKRLRDGIKMHGLVGGIIWNKRTGNIVGGHQRIQQLDELEGKKDYELDVDVIDVDESEEREINILLNNPTAQGEFDGDKLADVLDYLRDKQRSVERTGFNMADIQVLLGDDYLTGEFAQQRDYEAEAIAKLEKIKLDGRQKEGELFGDKKKESITVPTPPPAKDETGAPVGDGYVEELKRRKSELLEENADNEDADYLVTLVFDNNATLMRFLAHFGLDHAKRYFSRTEIEAAFDINLVE